jgi:hypothetical protein
MNGAPQSGMLILTPATAKDFGYIGSRKDAPPPPHLTYALHEVAAALSLVLARPVSAQGRIAESTSDSGNWLAHGGRLRDRAAHPAHA